MYPTWVTLECLAVSEDPNLGDFQIEVDPMIIQRFLAKSNENPNYTVALLPAGRITVKKPLSWVKKMLDDAALEHEAHNIELAKQVK